MKLNDVFTQLAYGELSQLAIGTGANGAIAEADYPKLLAHINLGLGVLYSRFHLKEGTLSLLLQPGRTLYPLTSAYAVSNTRSREPVRYLEDSTAMPFKDDLIKVVRAYSDSGDEMGLNDVNDHYALATPTLQTLRVPQDIVDGKDDLPLAWKTARIQLAYRANHPLLVVGDGYFDPARIVLELPDSHLQALLLFVASRVHNPIGMSNEFHSGNNYAAKFEAECLRLANDNIAVDQGAGNTRLNRGGWA